MQEDPKVFLQIANDISQLWSDQGIKSCYERRNEFQLNDSTSYYMENIERYAVDNYVPNDQDIIQARVKTTGIIENEFLIKGLVIRMIDVGGQRSERKKWIHCFENVHAILFLTAMSEYDMVLEEDQETNRMRESLKLFDSIANNNFFSETAIIIFFNKRDIFEEKLNHSLFSTYFPEYEGDNDYDSVSGFIQQLFKSRNRVQGKRIYLHFTTATNTQNIEFVFNSVIDVVSNINLKEVGLV
ncbi:guanine nucleotide-binding protein G(i) subunit alpha-2-like [Pempheris klunzingeri]|uniref:guanine nucleotide-binding protein G(i) subunit alpha-2-like n=1 Tax=Pempheris klunzingeri TaxID=3127111 RepID=UPI00397F1A76